ncbi:hypothetical protein ACEPAH_9297 [Sanghuangporus vaninii]
MVREEEDIEKNKDHGVAGEWGAYSNMMAFIALIAIALATSTIGSSSVVLQSDPAVKACQFLQDAFPQSVSFPGSDQYNSDIKHWAVTSIQNAVCSVEPETADDIGEILRIIGRHDVMAPFAIKSGGHALSIGHSSTTGVQISMTKFDGLEYDPESGTVTIGSGLTWDQVYRRLEPLGVMVTGGRVVGVGVTGLSLGGGYSWKTNQYGLTIDTIVSHNIVLPDGEQVRASNESFPDLFFGLKGGLNNFGIVTNITFETHPQTLVYGGIINYAANASDAVNEAITVFSDNNMDPRAQIMLLHMSTAGQFSNTVVLFYDGPTPPNTMFDAFFAIPCISSDVKARTFVNYFELAGSLDFLPKERGSILHAVPITDYPKSLLRKIAEEVSALENRLTTASNGLQVTILLAAQMFLNHFSHSRGGAYPHSPSRQVTPLAPLIIYEMNPKLTKDEQLAFHAFVISSLKEFSSIIQTEAVAEGVSRWDDILYPNYALDGTPLELMYGSNVEMLREIAAKYDPDRIMRLTGGPRF